MSEQVSCDNVDIVPRAAGILKKHWDATASILVMELEEENSVFTTITIDCGVVDDEHEGIEGASMLTTITF
jgi:hypothetical protein